MRETSVLGKNSKIRSQQVVRLGRLYMCPKSQVESPKHVGGDTNDQYNVAIFGEKKNLNFSDANRQNSAVLGPIELKLEHSIPSVNTFLLAKG